jgi:hypothetical protein
MRVIVYMGKLFREDKEIALYTYFMTAYCYSLIHIGGQHKKHRHYTPIHRMCKNSVTKHSYMYTPEDLDPIRGKIK